MACSITINLPPRDDPYTITARLQQVTGSLIANSTNSISLTVNKANQTAPAAPTVSTETPSMATSVTLNAITTTGQGAMQYGYTTGGETSVPDDRWQTSATFNNLNPGTAYTFYARYAGNEYYNPAVSTSGTTVTTNYAAPEDLNFMSSQQGEATATWDEVTGATSYTLQLYKGEQAVGNEVTETGTSHTFTISEAGTYYFTVKATGNSVDGEVSKSNDGLTFYEVKFDSTGGTDVPSQFVATGQKPNQPDTPIKSGYAFDGWYSDESLSTAWDFTSSTVNAATTLYAKWLSKDTSVESVTVNDV